MFVNTSSDKSPLTIAQLNDRLRELNYRFREIDEEQTAAATATDTLKSDAAHALGG